MSGVVTAGLISAGGSLLGGLFGASSAKRRARAAAKEKARLQAKLDNLGVATQAARNQSEQADISLANTLDTIRATGASAGGATALAQAALQSKRGVSASIEQQEAQNEKLRAQGEVQLQQQKMSEAQRLQQADVSGKQFVFGAQETREMQQLDRVSAQLSGSEARQAQANADKAGAWTSAIGGITSGLSAAMGPKG